MPIARAISTTEAAKYVGCSSTDQFRREVAAGTWPRPIAPNSRPQRWSVGQLDRVLRGDDGTSNMNDIAEWAERLDKRLGLK